MLAAQIQKAEVPFPRQSDEGLAGWYMVNVLEMPSEDVAIALGHEDGGELVRRLYGHRDRDQALDRVVAAYAGSGRVRPLRLMKDESA